MHSKRSLSIIILVVCITSSAVVYSASLFGNIRPITNNTYYLGTNQYWWKDCYCLQLHGSAGNITGYSTYNLSYDSQLGHNTSVEIKTVVSNCTQVGLECWNNQVTDTANTTEEIIETVNETAGFNFTDVVEFKFKDDAKALFGDDDDICLYWDGTSFIITDDC